MRFAFYRQQKHISAHLDRFAFSSDGEVFLYSYTTSKETLDQMRLFLSSNVSLFSHPGRTLHESFSCLLDKLNAGLKLPGFRSHLNGQQNFLIFVHRSNEMHFSILGTIHASYLSLGKISGLSDGMSTSGYEFGYISSGEIIEHAVFFVSHRLLRSRLIEGDLIALSESLDEDILYKNIEYIWNEHTLGEGGLAAFLLDPKPQFNPLLVTSSYGDARKIAYRCYEFLRLSFEKIAARFPRIRKYFVFDRRRKIALFLTGVILSCGLLFFAISTLIRIATTPLTTENISQTLLEVRNHLEEAGKNSVNREMFVSQITQAETKLSQIKASNLFLQDRLSLSRDIDILKKQVNGIVSLTPGKETSWYTLSDEDGEIIGAYEMGQKFALVSRTMIVDGVDAEGKNILKTPLPAGERARDATKSEDGGIYILLESNRIVRYAKGELKTVSISSSPGSPQLWEEATKIKSFNGLLYLLSKDGKNLYRYKPVVSSFSARSDSLLSSVSSPYSIQDFSVDGVIYLLRSNASIEKITTAPAISRKTLVYTSLPADTLPIVVDEQTSRIHTSQNSKNFFVLSRGDAMVLRPNTTTLSRQSELEYLGALDIPDENIVSILAVNDTTLLILTNKGFYRIEFQVTNNRILPR